MANTMNTRRPPRLQALLIPADIDTPARLVDVDDTAAAIAASISAHQIDDALTCHLPAAGAGPRHCTLYRAGGDVALRANHRAGSLLDELGAGPAELHGDVLVLGLGEHVEQDLPVPHQVLDAATRIGLLH